MNCRPFGTEIEIADGGEGKVGQKVALLLLVIEQHAFEFQMFDTDPLILLIK